MKTIGICLWLCLLFAFSCSEALTTTENSESDLSTVGYMAGYNTCGLSIQNGTGQGEGYIFISTDLKDTLIVYGTPLESYYYPEEAFPEKDYSYINVWFPKEYRYKFMFSLKYKKSSVSEVTSLGLCSSCVIPSNELIKAAYNDSAVVIVKSAKKME